VVHFFQHLTRINNGAGVPDTLKLCAIGPATAQALKDYGFEPDLIPERFVAEGVIEAFERHVGGRRNLNGIRVLFPRARVAREVLPEALVSAGVQLDVVVCYETVKAELSPSEIRNFKEIAYDLIIFTSSSTVTNTLETFGYDVGRNMILRSAVAAIGPITADTLKSFGKQVEVVPRESTIPSLIEAVEQYFNEHPAVQSHG
ncbi:MAG: uroporphyrinogen-III synthase, partial [Acidobacteriota bacterium]